MNEVNERVELDLLDPGSQDPGFWNRFHGRVLARARDELSRRRLARRMSVPDVVFHWRKTLVPVALLAATLAGVFLMGHEEGDITLTPVALEEALVEGLSGDPIPMVLDRTADLDEMAFLAGSGGFRP
jgi:hypothetical protein